MTKAHRYYFQIPDASVFECVHAVSFCEAKQKAYEGYAPLYNRIEWVNTTPCPCEAKKATTLPVTITK